MPMFMPQTQTGGLASALQPQGNLLQRLLGGQAASGIGQRLTDLLDPRVALPMAGALIGGRTPQAGIGQALGLAGEGLIGLGEERKQTTERNRAKEYLTKSHPELAQMVDMGLPVKDAFSEALKLDRGDDTESTSGIKEYKYAKANGFTGSFMDWQNAGKEAKTPSVVELFDEESGAPYKAVWNAGTGSFDRMGGTKAPPVKAPTEQVVRNRQLYKVVAPEVKNLLGDNTAPGVFDSLASTGNQVGNAVSGIGKSLTGIDASGFLTSEKYQQAKNSIKTIYTSYIYSVSGASAPEAEVERQASLLMPVPGEPAASVADKKQRIQRMADAIKSVADGGGNDVMQDGVIDAADYFGNN